MVLAAELLEPIAETLLPQQLTQVAAAAALVTLQQVHSTAALAVRAL